MKITKQIKVKRTVWLKVNLKYMLVSILWIFLLFMFLLIYGHYMISMSGDIQRQDFVTSATMNTETVQQYLKSNNYDDMLMAANQVEVLIDMNQDREFNDVVKEIEHELPFLPLDFWARQTDIGRNKNNKTQCGKFPSIFELEINNNYWQTQRTSNGTYQLYGAYLDNRKNNFNEQYIRILGMIDRVDTELPMYCQIWYDQQKTPEIVKVQNYYYIWVSDWGNAIDGQYQPYLISCDIPEKMKTRIPVSVSLVEHKCDTATNNLKVLYSKPKDDGGKKGFAVCVKGLDFLYEDISVRLIEWIELIGILGASKIYFYELQVHPNISKVLQYYIDTGKIEVTKLTLPAGKPNIPGLQHLFLSEELDQKRQNEIIPYNDCLYKNMYLYDYITLLDIDEVIMPKLNIMSWPELTNIIEEQVKAFESEYYSSFKFRNVYFLDTHQTNQDINRKIPEFLHMLQHTHRAKMFSEPNEHIKCFHRTDRIVTLHNHFAMNCLEGLCATYEIDVRDAQLQHYRYDCVTTEQRKCDNMTEFTIEDNTIYKFKDQLIKRSLHTLFNLGFLRFKNETKPI